MRNAVRAKRKYPSFKEAVSAMSSRELVNFIIVFGKFHIEQMNLMSESAFQEFLKVGKENAIKLEAERSITLKDFKSFVGDFLDNTVKERLKPFVLDMIVDFFKKENQDKIYSNAVDRATTLKNTYVR